MRTTMVAGDYPFTNLPITYRFGASTAKELLVSFFGRKSVQSILSVAWIQSNLDGPIIAPIGTAVERPKQAFDD